MSSSSAASSFSELLPELFPVISAELPLAYRLSTLLSLALTCHRLHDVVVPYLLYNNVRLVGEDQAVSALKALIAKAEVVSEEEIQTKGSPSPSHCIHHLCIASAVTTPIRSPDNFSLATLHKLIDVNGLRNLSALTLHVDGSWDGTEAEDILDAFWAFPPNLWKSVREKCRNLRTVNLTSITQRSAENWIDQELFSIEGLTSISLEGTLHEYRPSKLDFSKLPQSLNFLQVDFKDHPFGQKIDATAPGGLFTVATPELRTLILDNFNVSDPAIANTFWKSHPKLERIELGRNITGKWFDGFEQGMLPNLKFLKCNILQALILLPHVAKTLVSICVLDTYNAQGAYLLRAVAPEGVLPGLRSLSIHAQSGNSPKPREGHRWREDENGGVTEADAKKPARVFDHNYLSSIAKAAPNLEELELMGNSNDTLDSITFSLSSMPKLERLTLSGPISGETPRFFRSSYNWTDYAEYELGHIARENCGPYAPETFEEAARDLANGCRTLNTVTIGQLAGDLLIADGLSARIIRERDGGEVKEVRRIRAWGNIIGREEEW